MSPESPHVSCHGFKPSTLFPPQANGDKAGHSFHEVQLEAEGNDLGGPEADHGGRGERVKQEISVVSPAQHQHQNTTEAPDPAKARCRFFPSSKKFKYICSA
jgi:hypothetical protein